jgi:hypothetical protein
LPVPGTRVHQLNKGNIWHDGPHDAWGTHANFNRAAAGKPGWVKQFNILTLIKPSGMKAGAPLPESFSFNSVG